MKVLHGLPHGRGQAVEISSCCRFSFRTRRAAAVLRRCSMLTPSWDGLHVHAVGVVLVHVGLKEVTMYPWPTGATTQRPPHRVTS
eukprot:13951743-Alexandrium_andersonii.AAC.1